MSSARGQANHALYLAGILIDAWRRDLEAESVATVTLTQAYLPAVRSHLTRAYGWFLLEISRPDQPPPEPPTCTGELPEVVTGKAVPPEIRECAILEREGWLAQVLEEGGAPVVSSSSNLAMPVTDPGLPEATQWVEQLRQLFDRMGDSLDEY